MAGVQRSVEVGVPVEKFFEVICDYERYADFIPEMKKVRLLKRSGASVEVEYTVQIEVGGLAAKTIHYTLRHEESPSGSMKWSMLKGEMMKSNDGSWTLEPAGEGRTRATYRVDVGFGLLVPKSIAAALTERGLPRLLEQFKSRAESLQAGKQASTL